MAVDPGVFQFIGESVDRAMDSFVLATSSQVIADFLPIATLGATMYFALAGYMIIAGRIQTPGGTVLIQAVKFCVLFALAMSITGYSNWVVGTIKGLESGLASAFATTSSGSTPMSVYATLDQTLGQGWDIAATLWERGTNRGVTEFGAAISDFITAAIIGGATALVGVPAGAMIIVAKAMLTLLLGIGPVFIMCLMWKPTAKFFDAWFGQVLTTILTIALVSAVAAFTMKIFVAFVGAVDLESDQSTLFTALTIAVLSWVMVWLLYKAGSIAQALAGGVSLGAITFGQIAAAATTGLSMPGNAGRAVNNTVNPQSTRLDPITGHQTTSRRLEHIAQGRSAFVPNPAYRQALFERYKNAWDSNGNEVRRGG